MEITTKRLQSGNLQIRFSLNGFYGYLLAESTASEQECVQKICRHIEAMQYPDRYLQKNLFSMAAPEPQTGKILVFKEQANSMAA